MDKSDWLAVILNVIVLGAGALMSILARNITRAIGTALLILGIGGLIFWFGYYRAGTKAEAQQAITGNGNTTVTVPGNNNSVIVSPSQPKPDGSADHPVAERKDCPAGTTIFLGGEMNFNGQYGASIPRDARVCFYGQMNGNGRGGLQVR
jgi:hypothetical protein